MTADATPVATDSSASTAYRLLWVAVLFDVLAFGVGFAWDRAWHTTHPFEDFLTPPHLFVYSMHALAVLALLAITLTPDLRRHFGPGFRLWPFPFAVPGAIAVAGGGFVVTALAGALDGLWHSAFGLDETAWSLPHSMLGWGIFVAFVGVVACRVAIRGDRPIEWWSTAAFGFLIAATAVERIPGPFLRNLSIAELEMVRRIPVLAATAPFQHTVRIYETWDITRLSPLFVPLAAASPGLAVELLRRFDPRAAGILLITGFLTYTHRFVPYVVPGAIVALAGHRAVAWRWLGAAGIGFGLAAALVMFATSRGAVGPQLVGAFAAMLTFAAGAWLGDRIWSVVEAPRRGPVLAFVALAGLGAPAATGIVDLALRAVTP